MCGSGARSTCESRAVSADPGRAPSAHAKSHLFGGTNRSSSVVLTPVTSLTRPGGRGGPSWRLWSSEPVRAPGLGADHCARSDDSTAFQGFWLSAQGRPYTARGQVRQPVFVFRSGTEPNSPDQGSGQTGESQAHRWRTSQSRTESCCRVWAESVVEAQAAPRNGVSALGARRGRRRQRARAVARRRVRHAMRSAGLRRAQGSVLTGSARCKRRDGRSLEHALGGQDVGRVGLQALNSARFARA